MRTTPYHAGAHLEASALTDASARCPACHGEARRRAVHRMQNDPEVSLLVCGHCGIASASMMPTPDALDRYYGAYYDDASEAPSVTFADVERFGRHIARRLDTTGRAAPLRVLDFGGGDGAVAIAMAKDAIARGAAASVEITLVDYADPRPGTKDITLRNVRELREVEGRFDVLIASAILEHIPDIRGAIEGLGALAAPGALFYARTPYWRPMLRLMPSIDITFPGHVHDIGPEFWNRVVDRFGLEASLVASQPSIVETSLGTALVRTLAASVLKLPSHLETRLRPRGWVRPWWGLVGGWEVFLRFRSSPEPSPPA